MKARAAFASLRHLWKQRGVSLDLKARVYKVTVRAVLLYGCETWPLKADDLRQLEVFDHHCLRSLARIRWSSRIRNAEVRRKCFGDATNSSIEYAISLSQFKWLGHVLRMSNHRLPYRALNAEPDSGWRKLSGGQLLTWQKIVKNKAQKLTNTDHVRLPGWGPRDSPLLWLDVIKDMAANRNQWRACCNLVAASSTMQRQ